MSGAECPTLPIPHQTQGQGRFHFILSDFMYDFCRLNMPLR
jgi:hypothetical protein